MTYSETAKELGIRWRVGKYGIKFLQRDPNGKIYQLITIVPLDGWFFDPHEIIESFANDPNFSIIYKEDK